MKIQNISDI